jgi:hypothetical protein
MIISWAQSTMARATPRRSLGPGSLTWRRVVVCGIDEVDMIAFLKNAEKTVAGWLRRWTG